jgi:hypothetical protein
LLEAAGAGDETGETMPDVTRWTSFVLGAALLACGGSEPPGDVMPPSILSRSPESGAAEVAPLTAVTIVFDEEIDPVTVTAQTFKLYRAGVAVPGQVTVTGATAVFTPDAELAPLTSYLVNLGAGVKDRAGNGMSYAPSWSFKTGVTCRMAITGASSAVDTCSVTLVNGGGGMIFSVKPTTVLFSGDVSWSYFTWPMEGTYSRSNTARFYFQYNEPVLTSPLWVASYNAFGDPDVGAATLRLTSVTRPDLVYIAHGTLSATLSERGTTSTVTASVVF